MKGRNWIKNNKKWVGIGVSVIVLLLVVSHYCGPSMIPEAEETNVEETIKE